MRYINRHYLLSVWDPPSWKLTWRHFLSAEGSPIWIKFCRLLQNDMSTAVIWSESKPDVEFQYGGRLGDFSGMSSQSCVTLQGAATGRIQRHVIPEPRITLQRAATWWIHCHDSGATCHIAGCSHLVKSMSWSCHIARHIENRFSPYLFFYAVWALTSGGFRTVADTLVLTLNISETVRDADTLIIKY